MRSFAKISLIIIILSTALYSSCGQQYIGYGVLYIEDSEQNLSEGKIYPIVQESEIRNVYTIEVEGAEAGIDVTRSSMSFHEKLTDAEAFAKDYSQWIDLYAVSLLNGLSIREEADGSAERLYKLREGQMIKIIGRNPGLVNIANHDGYWYLVLTEDGTSGYCFDKNLRIFNAREVDADSSSVLNTEKLNLFLERVYRPEYFQDLIRDNTLDLSRFRTTRGIFAYPDENKVVLSTKEHQLTFDYTSISQNSSGRFIFEGSSLVVEVRTQNRIAVYFNDNNQEYAEVMIYIENMEELIEAELERRDLIFEEFENLATVSSTAYGRITFGPEKTFSWNSYKRLVPNVIPETAGDSGHIALSYFPAPALRADYDGVVSFSFDNVPGGGLVNFLFTLSELGVKLVYVPQGDINKGIVEQESSSPLVIFMSGAGE
ncbi:MAG: SH3 domain-containing protein [Spirochaetales bacterium]|uniref:SH3 domain-containing protein n=1 Tax=Candidatus Thalassospirochaeta sargassi TaxID=3119039 RepID=A0AAJ1MLE0_9SPIO|nr:SH3 domain-containing protein [Spirochaetales bacterium]